jgi:hypothetical protein
LKNQKEYNFVNSYAKKRCLPMPFVNVLFKCIAKIIKRTIISKYLRVPPDILRNTSCTPAAIVQEVMSQILCVRTGNACTLKIAVPPLLPLASSSCEQTRIMKPIKGSTVKMDPDSLQSVINKAVDTRGRKKEK